MGIGWVGVGVGGEGRKEWREEAWQEGMGGRRREGEESGRRERRKKRGEAARCGGWLVATCREVEL